MPKDISSETAFASAKVRLRKKRSGSIGAGLRSSHATNAASNVRPATIAPTICRDAQPTSLPRTRPQTIPTKPVLASSSPRRSRRLLGP